MNYLLVYTLFFNINASDVQTFFLDWVQAFVSHCDSLAPLAIFELQFYSHIVEEVLPCRVSLQVKKKKISHWVQGRIV